MNRILKSGIILWGLLFLYPGMTPAQDNETCEMCHSDETLTTIRYGVELSLYVTEDLLSDTPHEGFYCIDCHTDLDGIDEFPHPARLTLPDCGSCHPDAQEEFIDGFFHPLMEKGYTSIPTCSDCHGKHEVSWKGQPRQVCGVCHQDVLNDFLQSAHWNEDAQLSEVTCVSCHAPHNKNERKQYEPGEWRIHLTESCRDCHAAQVENYDRSRHYREVVRGNPDAPVCSDCHSKHKVLSPRDPESKVSVAQLDIVCTNCHTGYENSIHRPDVNDDPRFETCVVCHTGHETTMVGGVKGSIFDIHLDEVCLRCHKDNLIVGERDAHGGIHRVQIAKIDAGEPANCGSCHDYHYLAPNHSGDRSLQKECGDCHAEQQEEYERSSHYVAWARGHEGTPTCIDCHDDRRIKKVDEQFVGQSVITLCSRCHANRELTMKFQINPDVVEGYESSYHGQMYQLGYQGERFATCISCHDNHHILPSDDPQSTISQANIINTCGQCHENANENFVKYLQHYTPHTREENPILNWINTAMIWLLGSVLFVFGGHTLLWLIRLMIKRFQEGPIKKTPKSPYRVRRFNRVERILHLSMVMGFLILASTGLPLKYSHTAAANWVVHNIIGFHTAAIAHRLGAGLLVAVFAVHLGLIFHKMFIQKKKGVLWGPHSLVPNKQDFIDFYEHIKYFLGLRKAEPKFGRWTYWEKFDYFAVFWGMFAIGLSGLTLWFPESFSRMFPGWLINAAHIIHSEEALLATAFIFTVHFFNTHLRPGVFPLDEVIFTGRMTEERFKSERHLEFEQLDPDVYQKRLTKPLPKWMKILFFTAGYTFLTLGMILLVLIVIGTFF